MSKSIIHIRFQNGINKQIAEKDILNELTGDYQFIESENPDFILFGPYGNDIPTKGNYTRIGYFCENMQPDMSVCEWAFGIPREEPVKHPRYKRIQWHGLDAATLTKPADYDPEEIFRQKKHFCNFLYSNRVPYRETFFKQLSRYKKIDAPGISMNNMDGIDKIYPGDFWQRKNRFISEYKFTIAFENYVYPGYQTEKLYDAMQMNSLPIYCGDQFIGEIFNTASFINVNDLVKPVNLGAAHWLEKVSQPDFNDMRPSFYNTPTHRIKRKLKSVGRQLKMNLQFGNLDFSPVIERIIELDQDKNKYLEMLSRPWFNDNKPPLNVSTRNRWMEIFNSSE